MKNNAIFVIKPYDYLGTWVFDDEKVDLVKEPFVFGIPQIIDRAVYGLENPKQGFTVLFSSNELPFYDLVLEKEIEIHGGATYNVKFADKIMNGWLCPALFKYFDVAPDKIYVKIEK